MVGACYTGRMGVFTFVQAFFGRIFRETWREYAAVFLCAAGAHAAMASWNGFPDPDSFYHAKMASMMLENGIVRGMPQLPLTTLADAFADHHLAYHLALVPFVAAFGALQGTAIATVVHAAAAITALHGALRAFGVRWAWAFTFIAATSGGFAFRMGLAKASAPAVLLLMLAMVAFRRGKIWALFAIAAAYVWTHGGWPILSVVGGAFVVARAFLEVAAAVRERGSIARAVRSVAQSTETRGLVAVVAGSVAGLVVNPYFPVNLRFYWEQIVQIAVVGHDASVSVGSEWYPYGTGMLVASGGTVMLALAALVVLALVAVAFDDAIRRDAKPLTAREVIDTLAPLLLACAFFVLTLRSKRHLEYFVPFAVIAIGTILTSMLARIDLETLRRHMRRLVVWPPRALEFLAAYVAIAFLAVAGRSLLLDRQTYREIQKSWTKYAQVSSWLSSHDPDAMVMTSNWDDFPALFFNDERLRLIMGLDPMFLHRKHPALYAEWKAIASGNEPNIGAHAKALFGARYVLVGREHEEMAALAEKDLDLMKVHEDDGFTLYAIR